MEKYVVNTVLIKYGNTKILKYTMAGSSITIFKIQKNTDIKMFQDQAVLSNSYIYFLVGYPPNFDNCYIYIGQANSRISSSSKLKRIQEHNEDATIWSEAFILTDYNNSFGATELNYLENQFYSIAKKSNRYIVLNNVKPCLGNISDITRITMDKYIENALVILNVAGNDAFGDFLPNPVVYKKENSVIKESDDNKKQYSRGIKANGFVNGQKLYCIGKDGSKAIGIIKDDKLEVQKGSRVSKEVRESLKHNMRSYKERMWLENNGIINGGVFTENHLFDSLTNAANVIMGKSATVKMWKGAEDLFDVRTSYLNKNDGKQIYCQYGEINALAEISAGNVIVKKGSKVSKKIAGENLDGKGNINYVKIRKKLEKDGVIKNGEFMSDYCFNSISMAASVIYGKKVNGKQKWKQQCKVGFNDLSKLSDK